MGSNKKWGSAVGIRRVLYIFYARAFQNSFCGFGCTKVDADYLKTRARIEVSSGK
jgi:hypothetical protein